MTAAESGSGSLVSERVAGGILPKVLTTFDMVAIFVAIVLLITNSAVVQSAGPSAFGWWILGFVVFLIPCAIATGQLGVMFPGEGSIYLWTHKAFGPFWGFFAGFCAWWPGVLVMVATGTSMIAFLGYAFPAMNNWPIQWQGMLIIGLIVVSALVAILRFRVTQNLVNIVFALYGLAILAMFVSGLDQRLPKAMSHVNKARVPDIAVWVQTVIAALFTLLAFVVIPSISSGSSVDAETKIYDVLQAAVTVIWCISIVILFVDILIILRRFQAQFQARRIAHPAVFWACSIIGGLASLVGVIATLSGSWTPLISNSAGSITVPGATITYGTWFWWIGGITVASLAVAVLLYLVGRMSGNGAEPLPAGAGRHRASGADG